MAAPLTRSTDAQVIEHREEVGGRCWLAPGLQERHSRTNRPQDTLSLTVDVPHDRRSRLQGARHDPRLSSGP